MDVVPIPLVILLVCVIGALLGLLNGVIVTLLNVTPFIATLGTMLVIYGINSLYYDKVGRHRLQVWIQLIPLLHKVFFMLGSFKLSYITLYALVAIALVWVIWNKTRFGKTFSPLAVTPKRRVCLA